MTSFERGCCGGGVGTLPRAGAPSGLRPGPEAAARALALPLIYWTRALTYRFQRDRQSSAQRTAQAHPEPSGTFLHATPRARRGAGVTGGHSHACAARLVLVAACWDQPCPRP